jgi:2OG-Fe(II) oxygenase superfamily
MSAEISQAATQLLIDPARLDAPATRVHTEPFPFLIAEGQLPASAAQALAGDFPRYSSAGFFPYQESDCGPSIVEAVEAISAPAYARALGAKLGVPELDRYPVLVTICRSLNKRHGTIHTDSRSKVASALLYLTPEWPHGSAGSLRFLNRIDSIDDLAAPEVLPVYGALVAFKRTDNSFHGHLPYEGERRVIQFAWLTSQEEKDRKTRRGSFSRLLKKLLGVLDTKWGGGRARDASHPD